MNQAPRAAWRTVLAITIVVGAGYARADDSIVRPAWLGEVAIARENAEGWPGAPPLLSFAPLEPRAVEGGAGPSFGQPVQPAVPPTPAPIAAIPTEPPMFVFAEQPVLVEWYTRFDYFAWNERSGGTELDSEHGTLYTLGCTRCFGADRFRGELFTGTINYSGTNGLGDLADSTTTYLGVRGEYEWLWDMNLRGWPSATVFAGVGTRFWLRDIRDGTVLSSGDFSVGHQETWWTFYPYVGLEKRWPCNVGEEIYVRGRLGCTVFTYQFFGLDEGTPLYPRPDITGQVECGFRHDQLFIAVCFEAMTWNASPTVRNSFQPLSQMFTTGLKLGLSF
jgi:hypothetical protein